MALELLGISGEGYEFSFVKISTYIDPFDYSKQIRLVIRAFFKSNPQVFSNPICLYFQSDRKIQIDNNEILDRSRRTIDRRYSERIGADKSKECSIPLEIGNINTIKGERNRIRIEIMPDDKKMLEILKKEELEPLKEKMFEILKEEELVRQKMLEIQREDELESLRDKMLEVLMEKELKPLKEEMLEVLKEDLPDSNDKIASGFIVDIIVKNEGIERESFLKSVAGWSRFAWKFHFKVWSITEDMEPIKAISTQREGDSKDIYFTNSVEEIQMFVMIPKDLVESHGQIIAHPGGDTVHIITVRDKNTFLISEENEEIQNRIKKWVGEGSMAISWTYGQTGSMSREVIVEHRRAHPKAWTSLIFATLSVIMVMDIFPKALCHIIEKTSGKSFTWCTTLPKYTVLVLFVLAYLIINIYNFSFYELRKKTFTNYLKDFSMIVAFSLIVMFISTLVVNQFIEETSYSEKLVLFAFIVIGVVSILSLWNENNEIKKGNIRIKETEITFHLTARLIVQILGVLITVFLSIKLTDLTINPIILFTYIHATVIGLPLVKSYMKKSDYQKPESDFIL
jgi:hypothetical protein